MQGYCFFKNHSFNIFPSIAILLRWAWLLTTESRTIILNLYKAYILLGILMKIPLKIYESDVLQPTYLYSIVKLNLGLR